MILRGMSGASIGASSGACLKNQLGHVQGIIWDMSGASPGACLGTKKTPVGIPMGIAYGCSQGHVHCPLYSRRVQKTLSMALSTVTQECLNFVNIVHCLKLIRFILFAHDVRDGNANDAT